MIQGSRDLIKNQGILAFDLIMRKPDKCSLNGIVELAVGMIIGPGRLQVQGRME